MIYGRVWVCVYIYIHEWSWMRNMCTCTYRRYIDAGNYICIRHFTQMLGKLVLHRFLQECHPAAEPFITWARQLKKKVPCIWSNLTVTQYHIDILYTPEMWCIILKISWNRQYSKDQIFRVHRSPVTLWEIQPGILSQKQNAAMVLPSLQ